MNEEEFQREVKLIQEMGLKTSPLRREYEQRVAALQTLTQKLLASGKTEEQTARILHAERRALGRQYKQAAPPLFREYIYAATAAKYGDPLGPTFDQLRKRKSCAQIIASASRPIENLDDRLTLDGFKKWYREQKK